MEIKKEKSLESIANRIGFVFILGHLLINPCYMFIEKFLNFSVINKHTMAHYLSVISLLVFLLKIDVKKYLQENIKIRILDLNNFYI